MLVWPAYPAGYRPQALGKTRVRTLAGNKGRFAGALPREQYLRGVRPQFARQALIYLALEIISGKSSNRNQSWLPGT